MDSFKHLLRRDSSDDDTLTPTMVGLLIALMCLVLVGIVCIGALLVLRRLRARRNASLRLPTHHTSPSMTHLHASPSTGRRGHRRTLTITSTPYAPPTVSYHDSEKAAFMSAEQSPPGSPNVPEIHITFPEDKGDKRGSRVVVVKITDNGNVGLEPYVEKDEQLPKYEARDGEKGDQWRSLDLEKMGGLKEKDEKRWG